MNDSIEWKPYKGLNGNSGILRYATGADFIMVAFKGSRDTYVYHNEIVGKEYIDEMKRLALKGKGLSTYISQNRNIRDGGVKLILNR